MMEKASICERCGYKTEGLFHALYFEPDGDRNNDELSGWLCRICHSQVIIKRKLIPQPTPTPSTITTSHYTTRSWGFFDTTENLHCEQIDKNHFLYNLNGVLGVAEVITPPTEKGSPKKSPYIIIEGLKRTLPKKILPVNEYYELPPLEMCDAFVKGEYTPRGLPSIVADIESRVKVLFDYAKPTDFYLWLLFCLQSHLKPILNNFFFMSVDATKGAGKTTLLEIWAYLSRHGYLGGDVSAACLPRMVEDLDLSFFLDELDQRVGKKGEEDAVNILRKGQRRGNKYTRMNTNTMLPEQFDVAGTHAFSFRGELEDAFMSRSLQTRTAESSDKKLPVLNVFKEPILRPLKFELFFWSMKHLPEIAMKVSKIEKKVSDHVASVGIVGGVGGSSGARTILYDTIMQGYSDREKEALLNLLGRNMELGYLALQLSHLLELDLHGVITQAMQEKQEDEHHAGTFYKELLADLLVRIHEDLTDDWVLKDGINAGKKFTVKTSVFKALQEELKTNSVATIGTKKFASLLKDIGFIKHESIMSQRPPGLTPRECLVFTEKILAELGMEPIRREEVIL